MSKKWKFGRMMDTGITYLILTAVAFVFFSRVSGWSWHRFQNREPFIHLTVFSQKNIVLQVFRSFLLIRHFITIRDGFLIHFLWQREAVY